VIKTILLAVDLGVHTPYLLQHAANLSKQYQAKLIIVHAIEPLGTLGHALLHTYLNPETTEELTTTGMDSLIKQIRATVIDSITEDYMEGEIDLHWLGDVIVRSGAPTDIILNCAAEVDADLLVLGSQSPGSSGDRLGSVSQKVLGRSKWPVYIIPSHYFAWQTPVGQDSQPQVRF